MIKHLWIQGLLLSIAPGTVIGSVFHQATDQCKDRMTANVHVEGFEQRFVNTVSVSPEETSIAELRIELFMEFSDNDQQTSLKSPTYRIQDLTIYGHSVREIAFNKQQFAKVYEPYLSEMDFDVQDAFFQTMFPLVHDVTSDVLQALNSLKSTYCNSQRVTIEIERGSRVPGVIEVKIGDRGYMFNVRSMIFEYLRREAHNYGFEVRMVDSL